MKKILPVIFIGLMLLAEGFFFVISAKSAVSTSTTIANQPLIPFTGSVSSISKPPPIGQMGLDKGTNKIRFTQTSIQFFRPSSGNITIHFPSVGTSLTTQALKNSTHIAYHFTGTFMGHTVDMFVYFRNSTNPYDKKIIIIGTISGLVGTIPLSISLDNVQNLTVSNCDTNNTPKVCTVVFFGSMGFSWVDIPGATYNNATRVLSFSVGASFFFDPLAQDGGITAASSVTVNTFSVTLTTANSPDVIIGFCDISVGNAPQPTFSDTSGLSWTLRGTAQSNSLFYFYAIANSILSSDTVTCTQAMGQANHFIQVGAFGISGANTASPFDSNAGLPAVVSSQPSATTGSVSVSTSNANDMIIGLSVMGGGTTSITAGSGFTLISGLSATAALGAEYKIVSLTQSSLSVSISWQPSLPWEMIGDAIKQAIVTVTKQQTKNCTFTSLSSPTCTFASNVPINDVSVVGVETSINTNTITSVTDSASNTYNLVTSFAVLSAVGLNAVYCSNVGSAGTLVVTVNFGAASTGVIVLYDLANAAASCAGTGSDDSVGSNALSSSPSVGSYTPSQTGFEIGFLNSGCNVACTVSAGGAYTKDNDVAITAALEATSESIANSATATTTPFSLSASSAWSEISVTFVIAAETTVTLPLTCTMSNSAPQQTLTLDGASASPATLVCDASSHNITVDKSSTLTILIPIDATNTRSRFKQGSSATAALTWSVATCSSGTCAGASNTTYYQLRNLYQATPVGPTVWDAAYTINVKGTVLGIVSTNCGTIATTAAGGAASSQLWCDYNLQVTVDSPVGPWTAIPAGTNTFTQTTGGNTNNVNYAILAAVPVRDQLPGFLGLTALSMLMLFFVFIIRRRRR